MKTPEFKKLILTECDIQFKANGFKVPRKNCILYPINNDFDGWVGLNVATNEGSVKINPFIGVHSQPVAETVATLQNQKYKLGAVATYAVHLGAVCPNLSPVIFDIEDKSDIAAKVERLVHTITEFGVAYAYSIASYEKLIPLLKEKIDMLGGFPESYAVALFNSGERDECFKFLEIHAQNIEKYGDSIVKPFAEFSEGLLKLSSSRAN